MPSPRSRVLRLIVCAAGPAVDVSRLIDLALERGWTPNVVCTPSALDFIDSRAIEKRTGSPIRSDYSPQNSGQRRLSTPDAVIIAPATFNTVNKLAAGINDNYALNVAAEAIGQQVPTVVLPFVNQAMARRAPFQLAIDALRKEGVNVLFGEGKWLPHPPGSGADQISTFPWRTALDAIDQS